MTEIDLRPTQPIDITRRLFLAGLISAFVVTIAVELPQFDAAKKCSGGAFSAAFSRAFDVSHCDLVIRKTGSEIKRVRLPQWWTNQILQ